MSRNNIFSTVIGNVYRNMVNGELFEITAVLPGGAYRVKSPDGTEAECTDKHLACSRFIKNDRPLPKPLKDKFAISETGGVAYDGQMLQTGTLNVMSVLATFPGGARFLVKGLDGKTIDIFDYNVVDDRFEKLAGGFVDVTSIYEDEDGVYAYLVEKEDEFEKYVDDDGEREKTEKLTSLEQTVYVCIGKATVNSFPMRDYLLGSFMKKTRFGEAPYQYGTRADVVLEMRSSKKFERMIDVDGYAHYVATDIDDEGESQFVRQFILEKTVQEGEGLWVTARENGWLFDANILGITVSEDWDRSLFVITEKGITFTNNGYAKRVAMGTNVVEAAKKHPVFVGLKPGTNHNEFVLANDGYEVVTIKVTKTDDRGYITEIVDGVAD